MFQAREPSGNHTELMERSRIDKWLWAARFFKTRALASKACELGRVESNAMPCKPSKDVRIGDSLQIKTEANIYVVEVLLLTELRGPAAAAQTMYAETEASKATRTKLAEERKAMPHHESEREGKPSKRDRRIIDKFRQR